MRRKKHSHSQDMPPDKLDKRTKSSKNKKYSKIEIKQKKNQLTTKEITDLIHKSMPSISVCKWRKEGQKFLKKKLKKKTSKNDTKKLQKKYINIFLFK